MILNITIFKTDVTDENIEHSSMLVLNYDLVLCVYDEWFFVTYSSYFVLVCVYVCYVVAMNSTYLSVLDSVV